MTESPVGMIGAELRLSRRVGFVTENYLIPALDDGPVISYALGFMGEQIALDPGFPDAAGQPVFPGAPYVAFVRNVRRPVLSMHSRRPRLASLAASLAAPVAALAATLAAPAAAGAQRPASTIERAAPFDAAGRVLVLTPALAARLALRPPEWPVAGPFVEARLWLVEGDGAVLGVTRPSGAVERFALTLAERDALVAVVGRAIAAAGSVRSDTSTVVSEPAGNRFVASQAGLGFTLYGPALAGSFADDAGGASIAYAVGLGASFGGALAYARTHAVTRAQSSLSSHMAYGGAAAAAALVSIADPEEDRAYAAAVLAGGIAGTVMGLRRGAGLSDAEATASGTGAVLALGAVVGVLGGAGALDERDGRRVSTAAGVGALAAGYAFGPRYARRRAFAVSAGDAQLLLPAALAGAAVGAGVGFQASRDDHARAWAATLGLGAGALLADRVMVRRFDFTRAEAALVTLGTVVGGGVGAAFAGANDAGDAGTMLVAGVGAVAGLAITAGVVQPTRAEPGGRLRLLPAPGALPGRPRLRLSPLGVGLAAAGVRGRFPVGTLAF